MMAPSSLVSAISSVVIGVNVTVVVLALISKCVRGDDVIDLGTTEELESSHEKWLVEQGVSLTDLRQPIQKSSSPFESWTAMCVACRMGELPVCRYLAAHGAKADIFKKDSRCRLPIEYACAHGHVDVAQWLLINDAGDSIATQTILPAIAHACRSGHTEIMKWLADNGGAEQIWGRSADFSGQSLLMIACAAGHLCLSQWLLEFGLDANAQDNGEWTPLICACSIGNLALVRWLYDVGAREDRESKNIRHQSEMMAEACKSGNLALVKWLNNRGTFTDNDRAFAILSAIWSTNLEIAKWLYDQGVLDFSYFGCSYLVLLGREVAWALTRNAISAFRTILSAQDYRITMQRTAVDASRKGLLHIAQFACSELSHEEFHFDPLYDPWCAAVAAGHTHILEWLVDSFPGIRNIKACKLGRVAIEHEKIIELKICVAACSIDELDSSRTGFFEAACENGHVEVLQWLLQELPYPRADQPWAYDLDMSMTTACQRGHLAVIECLVTEGVVDLASDQILELLVVSCSNGHLEIAQWLHEEFSLTLENYQRISELTNMSVVNIACSRGDHPMVEWMFSIGGIHFFQLPEVQSAWEIYGQAAPPILTACLNGHFTLVKWLLLSCCAVPDILNMKLYHGFQVRLVSDLEFTQQIVALFSIHDVDLLDDDEWNFEVLISGSLSEGYFKIFEWLRTLGKVNPKSKNREGGTFFHLACAQWNLDVIKWLFENGARDDIRIPCLTYQDTPMLVACKSQDLETMKWLFENGARDDIRTANKFGDTPMSSACQEGHLDVVKWLFKNGARDDIQTKDNSGNTPMKQACQNGHLDIARWLFKVGAQADVRTQDNHGGCPMIDACSNNHYHVAEWLYECGASDDVRLLSQDYSVVRWHINRRSEMAQWLYTHGMAHNSAGEYNKSLLGLSGRKFKLSRKIVSGQMVSVLTDHTNLMSLILPAIHRERLESPVCLLQLFQGHEKSIVRKIVDFAGIPRGRCLKNTRDVARSLVVDQVGACTFRSKMAAARRRCAEEALAVALFAENDAELQLSQAQKDYAYV